MRRFVLFLLAILIVVLSVSCALQNEPLTTLPEPILLDENFEDGTIDSELGCYSPSDLFIPKIVQDGDNSVLQLSSSTDSLFALGLSDEDIPMYSGAAFGGGPNQRTINTSWDYEVKYLMKVVSQVDSGKGIITISFRYYGDSFDCRTNLNVFSSLDFHLYSYPTLTQNDLMISITQGIWVEVKIVSKSSGYEIYIDDTLAFEEADSPVELTNCTWEVADGMTVYLDDISIIRTDIL
ncbi:MAG: hypothetical protein KAR21_03075 [Spirochaetales bacterium]|nr:hypothetical protein [Spirochaetales bacterium]